MQSHRHASMTEQYSYNSRYLDDICAVNLEDFYDIVTDIYIYGNTFIFEGSNWSYKQDTFFVFIFGLLVKSFLLVFTIK